MTEPNVRLFRVGGCVRDSILGIETKDIDFAVEAESFTAMRDWMVDRGFTIFVETPEFLTIRAHFPKDDPQNGRLTADFVLCRRDGRSSNNRHPDEVTPGSIFDDLERRDFTVNAMAIDEATGELIDPHGGQEDLTHRILRFVGEPMERIEEDALRVLRGVRFTVTKDLHPTWLTMKAMREGGKLLDSVSTERVREELVRAFKINTRRTLQLLDELELTDIVFERHGLWLMPTMKAAS